VREETGLDITAYLDQPTVLDDIASSLPRPNYLLEEKISAYGGEPEHYHLDQLYVVTVPEQAVSHRLDESHGIGWFSLDQLAGLPMLENTLTILKQELTK
jgi:ADP-ribose pyrophosphatase YjhB (NUDIX family)